MSLKPIIEFEGAVKPDAISVDSYEPNLFAKRITEIPSNMQARFVWDGSNNCTYAAYAVRELSESNTGWLLQKFTYDGSNNCTSRLIAYDSFDNYLTASYA